MQSDDTIKVPTWRPDNSTATVRTRVQRPQPAQPAETAPDDKRPAPAARNQDSPKSGRREPISLDELAENLRRMNMTFDLFEIQAKFIIDQEDHQVKVIVRNTKTGEVIRSIPPAEFSELYNRFMDGLGTTFTGTA